MRRESSLTLAMKSQACALSIVASKSFARRRFRLSQAMVRSTTQRRGSGSKPTAASDRLTMSRVHCPRTEPPYTAPSPLPCLPLTGGGTSGPHTAYSHATLFSVGQSAAPQSLVSRRVVNDATRSRCGPCSGIVGVVVPWACGGRRGDRSADGGLCMHRGARHRQRSPAEFSGCLSHAIVTACARAIVRQESVHARRSDRSRAEAGCRFPR